MTRRTVPLTRLQGLLDADRGLTSAEVRDRLARYGPNDIIELAGTPWWDLVRDTARDPMIWFLLVTSVLLMVALFLMATRGSWLPGLNY